MAKVRKSELDAFNKGLDLIQQTMTTINVPRESVAEAIYREALGHLQKAFEALSKHEATDQ